MRFMSRAVLMLLLVLGACLSIGCSEKTTEPENPPPKKATVSIVGWGIQVVVELAALEDLIAVSASWDHSLGLKSDGTIVAWGNNLYGQCNVPAPNGSFVAVSAGQYYSLGLKSDGTIVACGDNGAGQCNVPAPNAGFVAVAAGYRHSLALRSHP